MELRKRGDTPYWMVDLVHPVTGKRMRVSTRETDKKRARVAAQAIWDRIQREAQQAEGGRVPVTLADALEQYVEHLRAARKPSAKGAAALRDKVLGLNPRMTGRHALNGLLPLHTLAPVDLQRLVAMRQHEGNGPQTIAHELGLLRAAAMFARELRQRAPDIDDWRIPATKAKTRYLSVDEWRAVYDYLDPSRPIPTGRPDGSTMVPTGARWRARQDAQDLFVALSMTGGRWGEVARITWDRVDTEGWQSVRLWGSKDGEERLVGLSEQARTVLRRRYAERAQGQPLVFPGRLDGPRGASCRAILRAMTACGLNRADIVAAHGRATVHSLRHTYASWLLQHGADLAEVQDALGHASIQMTRRYAHLAKHKTAARLGALLSQYGPALGGK